MPYQGIGDPDLPAAVKKLPKALRELWVRVFNENYDAADEGKAFRIAWGVVRKVRTAKKAKFVPAENTEAMRKWLAEQQDLKRTPVTKHLTRPAQFGVKQMTDGRVRWTMLSSGAFEDRDGQIVSAGYLRSALDFAARTGYKGTLNIWHIRNSNIGQCDYQLLVGEPPVLIESGLFDETPAGRAAARYYMAHASEKGGSIEYLWSDLTPDGVFNPPGVLVRRSALPRERAAFPWSGLLVKEHKMPKTRPEQIEEFAKVLGVTVEEAAQMVEQIESGTKELADYGVRWKEIKAAEAVAPVETPAVQAAETPATASVETTTAPEVTTPETEQVVAEETEAETYEVVFTPETMATLIDQLGTQMTERFTAAVADFETKLAELKALLEASRQDSQLAMAAAKEAQTEIAALKATDEAKIAAAVRDLPRATVKALSAPQRPTQRDRESTTADGKVSQLELGMKTLHG